MYPSIMVRNVFVEINGIGIHFGDCEIEIVQNPLRHSDPFDFEQELKKTRADRPHYRQIEKTKFKNKARK